MTDAQASSSPPARSSPRAIARRFAQIGLLIVFQAVLLFAAAGTFDWWPGWAYLGLYLFLILVNAVAILPNLSGEALLGMNALRQVRMEQEADWLRLSVAE